MDEDARPLTAFQELHGAALEVDEVRHNLLLGVPADDAERFVAFSTAFFREAVPDDPVPSPDHLAVAAGSGEYTFWVVEGEPVSMAGIMRRTRSLGAIAAVYTPPALRGRGYAAAVTAAVADQLRAEGRSSCLYTDLRNPSSNRCYAKIGFVPACDASHVVRRV